MNRPSERSGIGAWGAGIATLSLLCAVATTAVALEAGTPRTVSTVSGRARPAWFVCDAPAGDAEAVVGLRSPRGVVRITWRPKHGGAERSADYAVGPGDPGAGQVYYPLSRGGRAAGVLHTVNPGAFDSRAPVILPPLSSIDIDGVRTACRLTPGARFIGFTTRRSVEVVRDGAGRLIYRTFDFGRSDGLEPSAQIAGGTRTARSFGFARAGYRYEIAIPSAERASPATLSVWRGGKRVQREAFLAYSAAP